MKIKLLVVVRWPVGGIRTYLRYVYGNFNPDRYSITLIAPTYKETVMLMDDFAKYDIKYIEVPEKPSAYDFIAQISTTIKNNYIDIIHSHGLTSGMYSLIPARIFNIDHIVTLHDVFNDSQFEGFRGAVKRKILAFALSGVNRIHAVSNDVKINLLEYMPSLEQKRISVILNGIEIERFEGAQSSDLRSEYGLADDTFLIGFLGRFMAQKGFRYLIDAMEILLRSNRFTKKPVVLAFGEDGFIREEKEYVHSKGMSGIILFCPLVANVAPVLKGLDVVVMPSLWEACGLLAMEAMVAGVPLIGTNCIGLREVLHDTPSRVIPPKNSLSLAEAIAAEMKFSSRNITETFVPEAINRFDVKRHSQEIEKLFSNIHQNKKSQCVRGHV